MISLFYHLAGSTFFIPRRERYAEYIGLLSLLSWFSLCLNSCYKSVYGGREFNTAVLSRYNSGLLAVFAIWNVGELLARPNDWTGIRFD
jgi:hypothetical protein